MQGITIIDNYKDLPLGSYQEILKIDKDESLEEIDKQVKIISILTGMDDESILDLPITEYKQLSSKLTFLQGELPKIQQRVAKSYKICKFELVPVMDMRKVLTSQYVDFQTYHQIGIDEHLAEILSCLLVPKGMKYAKDYDVLEVQDAIRSDLSVYDAVSLYSFFMISCGKLIKDTLISSLQEVKKIKDKEKREQMMKEIQDQLAALQTSGDGLLM